MPELPEVHTTVKGINEVAKDLIITDVWSNYNSAFHAGKPNIKNRKYFSEFKKRIVGAKIMGARRRAKNILIDLSNKETILIHMKMTGHIMYGKYAMEPEASRAPFRQAKIAREASGLWSPLDKTGPLADPFNKFIRFVISFSNSKHLVLSDMRRFAKVCLFKTSEIEKDPDLKELGPEPLEKSFTEKVFVEQLMHRPTWKIKQALLDQTLIAGIGNIYSDELLWKASVHPLSIVQNIPKSHFKKMFTAMKQVLEKGIDFGGDSMSDYRNIHGERGKFQHEHNAYRLTGKPCKKKSCKGIIARLKVGGRSAHFCSVHQKQF